MIVVSDTTPLISLLKIDKVYLLEKLFGRIFILQAVFNELVIDKRFIEEADIIRNNSQIEVKEVGSLEAVDILRRLTGLDIGESEAIVLADELSADVLLMDEAKGRNVSKDLGHKVMGTIGIIMVAYDENLLTSEDVKECIEQLKKSGRHIGSRYYNMLLSRIDSRLQ